MSKLAAGWLIFGTWAQSLQEWPKCKNEQYSTTLTSFLKVGAPLEAPLTAIWGDLARMLAAVFRVILGEIVASRCQDGAQER